MRSDLEREGEKERQEEGRERERARRRYGELPLLNLSLPKTNLNLSEVDQFCNHLYIQWVRGRVVCKHKVQESRNLYEDKICSSIVNRMRWS